MWAYRMALFGRDIARVGDDESQCPLVARLDIQNLRGFLAQFRAPGFRPEVARTMVEGGNRTPS